MKHQIARRNLVLVLAVLAALSTQAFGATPPWTVYRSPDASATESAAPVASPGESPWDDAPGVLSDGNTYFYLVTDGNGLALPLSVDKNPVLDTVRLGFDDGDPTSAPVDAFESTVTVEPAIVPADGLSSAWVTIVPRDADGVSLGTGLALSIDAVALWPGTVAGSIVDVGNGTYVARVVSSFPGQGVVWVVVEGVSLADEPTIDFESTGPMSLRDQALLQLDGLTSPGGAFDQLLGSLDPTSDPGAAEVVQAKADALASLGLLFTGDPQSDDEAVKDLLKYSIVDLVDALADPGQVDTAAAEQLIRDLLDIARLLAQYWYEVGSTTCDGTDHAGWSRLDQAEIGIFNGDASYAAGDWVGAATHYGKSIEKSLQALAVCN